MWNFFNKLENTETVEQSFNFFIKVFKNSNSSNEIFMEFLTLYKNKLMEYFQSQDANINKEKYYRQFIEKNLNLADCDVMKIQFYMEKLGIESKVETKDLMINAMSEKIAACG